MLAALLVAVGGAVGSLGRYGVAALVARLGWNPLWSTWGVNIIGSVSIGLIVGLLEARELEDSRLRLLLCVGVLGGFTTYSGFALDSIVLLQRRQWLGLLGYVGGTLVVAAAGCALGLALARWLR